MGDGFVYCDAATVVATMLDFTNKQDKMRCFLQHNLFNDGVGKRSLIYNKYDDLDSTAPYHGVWSMLLGHFGV